jgi:hypothetical protein
MDCNKEKEIERKKGEEKRKQKLKLQKLNP